MKYAYKMRNCCRETVFKVISNNISMCCNEIVLPNKQLYTKSLHGLIHVKTYLTDISKYLRKSYFI